MGPRLLARALRRQVEETRETMRAVEVQRRRRDCRGAVRLAGTVAAGGRGGTAAAAPVPTGGGEAREAAARPKPEPGGVAAGWRGLRRLVVRQGAWITVVTAAPAARSSIA